MGNGSSLIAFTNVTNSGEAIISPSRCFTAAVAADDFFLFPSDDDDVGDALPIPAARQSSIKRTNFAKARVCLSLLCK